VTLKKREDTENLKRKYYIALCGELALGEAVDLSFRHNTELIRLYKSTYYIMFNSNKSPTRCNNFSVYYPDVYLQLNMFRASSRPSSGAQ
jgi:hypothetical protein